MTGLGVTAPADWDRVTGAFLVIDIRGWSDIVYALGPEPAAAAVLVNTFWCDSKALVKAEDGEVYSWQGDHLLVAYRGGRLRRLERALRAASAVHALARTKLAPLCWQLLQDAEFEARRAGETWNAGRAPLFSVSSAITDGKAIAVPQSDSGRNVEELTADCINFGFALVKEVPPDSVGVPADLFGALRRQHSKTLDAFSWNDETRVPYVGTTRSIRAGILNPVSPGNGSISGRAPAGARASQAT